MAVSWKQKKQPEMHIEVIGCLAQLAKPRVYLPIQTNFLHSLQLSKLCPSLALSWKQKKQPEMHIEVIGCLAQLAKPKIYLPHSVLSFQWFRKHFDGAEEFVQRSRWNQPDSFCQRHAFTPPPQDQQLKAKRNNPDADLTDWLPCPTNQPPGSSHTPPTSPLLGKQTIFTWTTLF